MSAKPSYCEVTITKAKKFIWTIDLSIKDTPKESIKKKPTPKHITLSPPKTLYEFTQRHIDEISLKTKIKTDDQKHVSSSKATRKLAKKIIKCKKARLSEVAYEVNNFFCKY